MNKNYLNIYNNLVKFSRNKSVFKIFTTDDTFSDRLIVFLFHFAFFLKILKNAENKQEMQKIYNFVFKQIELSIREAGYGDTSVNKIMKTYINFFYSIINKVDEWDSMDFLNKNNLLKSFFNFDGEMTDLIKYFDKYSFFLSKTSLNSFTKGVIKSEF